MRVTTKFIMSVIAGLVLAGSAVAENEYPVQTGEGFTAGEHVLLGDVVKVYLSLDDAGATGSQGKLLHLENGLALSYGDIVSLGDFYGMPSQPISFGKTKADRENSFLVAFNQFSTSTDVVKEVQSLLDITHEEKTLIDEAISHSQNIDEVYKKISDDHNRRYNCATGGGCGSQWWLYKGRYLKLAETDYDHFGENSIIAYQTGHDLAVAQAIKAHDAGDVKLLEKAYAMNAFAGHFLSDSFSAGHIRTARLQLDLSVTPAVVGALLSHYMHDEESEYGLHVYNLRGDRWMAYGDKHYFDKANAQHRYLVHEAMQESANEIFAAYKTGLRPSSYVIDIIPHADYVNDAIGQDIAPMFYWDDSQKKLYRRSELSQPYHYHFTTSWWGWSTFLELSSLHGTPNSFKRIK